MKLKYLEIYFTHYSKVFARVLLFNPHEQFDNVFFYITFCDNITIRRNF